MEFEYKSLNVTYPFSMKDMLNSVKKLDWLNYEVDPEWKRFCSFGPDDIGGPFEKLCIIRKRHIPSHLVINPESLKRVQEKLNDRVLSFDPGKGYDFTGISVITNPMLPHDQAYIINPDPMHLFFSPNPTATPAQVSPGTGWRWFFRKT